MPIFDDLGNWVSGLFQEEVRLSENNPPLTSNTSTITSVAGRVEMAEQMVQSGVITNTEEYLQVMNSRNYNYLREMHNQISSIVGYHQPVVLGLEHGVIFDNQLDYGFQGYGSVANFDGTLVTIKSDEWAPGIWAGMEGSAIAAYDGDEFKGLVIIERVDLDNKQLEVSTHVALHNGFILGPKRK